MALIDPDIYGKLLMQQVDKASRVEKISVKVGDWEPQRNMCHHNASYFCECNPEYTPVRGWLYFELPGINFAKFLSHSVVRAVNGVYYDITPWEATEHYPFIDSGLSEDDYAELVEVQGFSELHPLKS